MKILFLTHRLPYAPNRGDRIRAYYLLREMAKFASVSLFSLVHDAEEEAHGSDVTFAKRVQCARVTAVRNHVNGALRLATARPLTHSLLDAPGASAGLASLVNADQPDVVLAFCSGMARFAFEAPLAGLPLVIDFVDVDSEKWVELAGAASPPMKWIYRREARTLRRFEAFAARSARASLVCTDDERDLLATLAPTAAIDVVKNGIDLDAFRPPRPPQPSTTVLFCGVMNYEPNRQAVKWFADAVWPLIRAARPDARFVVVGLHPPADILTLGARDQSIQVVGAVPEVQPYLWDAAVSVAPIQIARGIQNKVLEALAAGLPCVVTPAVFAGLPEEAQSLCDAADDASGFARLVLERLNDPAAGRARAAAVSLEPLGWSNRLAGLRACFEQALSRSPSRERLAR